MLRTSATLALLALAMSCGSNQRETGNDGGTGGDGGGMQHLTSVGITPLNPIVQLDLNMPGSQTFTLTGSYPDLSTIDLSGSATWTISVGSDTPSATWMDGSDTIATMGGNVMNINAFTAVSAKVALVHASVTTPDGTFTATAQITVVAYRQTGSSTDFFFTLPYNSGSGTQTKTLSFSTAIPALDVFFLMDSTGSMGGEIDNLSSGLSGIATTIQASTPNSEFGAAHFDDFPVSPYSYEPDQPFILSHSVTSDVAAVTSAMLGWYASGGGDTPEAGYEAAYQAATGPEGLTGPDTTSVPSGSSNPADAVGFRPGAMPVIVEVSDASSHWSGDPNIEACDGEPGAYSSSIIPVCDPVPGDTTNCGHSPDQVVTALNNICARYVGIAAINDFGDCDSGLQYMTNLAGGTNTRVPPGAWDVGTRPAGCSETQCCTGQNGAGEPTDGDGLCPAVFQVSTSGTGVSDSISTGITMLTRFQKVDVPTATSGVTTDITGSDMLADPHTTADFVKSVIPISGPSGYVLPPPPPGVPPPTVDADGLQFDGVSPGTTVKFTVSAFNDFVPQTSDAQIFEATIAVTASGCQIVLDQRTVIILVPPTELLQ